jgi:hypothetical protein
MVHNILYPNQTPLSSERAGNRNLDKPIPNQTKTNG